MEGNSMIDRGPELPLFRKRGKGAALAEMARQRREAGLCPTCGGALTPDAEFDPATGAATGKLRMRCVKCSPDKDVTYAADEEILE
jgi:hypothetical protein